MTPFSMAFYAIVKTKPIIFWSTYELNDERTRTHLIPTQADISTGNGASSLVFRPKEISNIYSNIINIQIYSNEYQITTDKPNQIGLGFENNE